MKLYKFRSLGSCTDLERTQAIVESGKFWCSRFWELNDPMEGVYWFNQDTLSESFIRKLYDAKSDHALCSFSGPKAFEHPLMWGYYANGFKGVAIEIEADEDQPNLEKMRYTSDVTTITQEQDTSDAARRILTTKLCCWSHEHEYRYLHEGGHGLQPIGRITAVYCGTPYQRLGNAEDMQRRRHIREYRCRAESLQRTAQDQGIACHQVDLDNGWVVISQGDD